MKKATSTWILRNSKHIGEILDSWDSQLVKSDHEHRLTLLYLANDVVQNCRKKHPDLLGTYPYNMGHIPYHYLNSSLIIRLYRAILFILYCMKPYESYSMIHID